MGTSSVLTQQEIYELIDLYHLAQTPVGHQRYDRLIWVAREFHKTHPNTSQTKAYIEVDRATRVAWGQEEIDRPYTLVV